MPGLVQRTIVRMARQFKPRLSLVSSDTIASNALVTVIAIMTFLATLTAGAAMLVRNSSQDWSSTVAREMTIQVKPTPGRDMEADARRAGDVARSVAGIRDVRVFSRQESAKLLEPWLGTGVGMADLPVPVLVVVKLDESQRANVSSLRESLRSTVPTAILDDHRAWVDRLDLMAGSLVAVALVVVLLVLTAMGLAVAFATRGAMAGSREIVDVLHFVGAADIFISRQFRRHFIKLGMKGAVVGGLFAVLAFIALGFISARWTLDSGGDQIEALFGQFDLGLTGYAAVVAIAGAMAILTGLISQSVVTHQLRRAR
jgi:cell division transport system permease protein